MNPFILTECIANTVPNLSENNTIFKLKVIRGETTATLQIPRISEGKVALVVAVALLIIGDKDILVATELFLGFKGCSDEFINRKGVIHSFHNSIFLIGYNPYIAKTVPNIKNLGTFF